MAKTAEPAVFFLLIFAASFDILNKETEKWQELRQLETPATRSLV